MTQYLFVYGTLKRRGGSRHRALLGQAEYMGEATYQGRLYRVSWYPAAVASSAADAHVCGELYRLEADADRLLRAIDQYEGCDAVDPEYERCAQTVRRSDGTRVRAWIYLYRHSTDNLESIESGEFFGESGSVG